MSWLSAKGCLCRQPDGWAVGKADGVCHRYPQDAICRLRFFADRLAVGKATSLPTAVYRQSAKPAMPTAFGGCRQRGSLPTGIFHPVGKAQGCRQSPVFL